MAYWFAVADRYVVFLYYHDMGPLVPDTSPFSTTTSGRYWMTGLVLGGLVMVLYGTVNFGFGRLLRSYRPPEWWRVWLLCALPLAAGIPLITMTANQPTLPADLALTTAFVALAGLALALLPGRLAAEQPGETILLSLDGLGFMMILLNGVGLERVSDWLARGRIIYIWSMVLATIIGLGLLTLVTLFRIWQRQPDPGPASLFLAAICVSYLLTPLVHYVSFTDGYYYITTADNFFARNAWLQIALWLLAAALATGISKGRGFLIERRAKPAVELVS